MVLNCNCLCVIGSCVIGNIVGQAGINAGIAYNKCAFSAAFRDYNAVMKKRGSYESREKSRYRQLFWRDIDTLMSRFLRPFTCWMVYHYNKWSLQCIESKTEDENLPSLGKVFGDYLVRYDGTKYSWIGERVPKSESKS